MLARKTDFEDSLRTNMHTYQYWLDYLTGLAINMFSYDGLPETVDERFLELTLINNGVAIYFDNPEPQPEYWLPAGRMVAQTTYGIELTVYDMPIYRDAWAANGFFTTMLNPGNSVMIFNNRLHTPDINAIQLFARRLTNITRAYDVNIGNQKFPFILRTTNNRRLSLENALMDVQGNKPAIILDKDFDMDSLQVFPLNPPFVADKLHVEQNNVFNDILTYFGIENSNQDKKERMVTDEVNSNYGVVEASRNIRLQARRDACKEIERVFGEHIEVNFNSDLPTILNIGRAMIGLQEEGFGEEGSPNEQVHDSSTVDSGASDS